MHTTGKNAYYRKITTKDLVRTLVNIPTFHYTRFFFFLEKQNLASINNLLKNYDVFLLCLYMQTHIDKQPINLNYKITLLDFIFLFNHRK